MLSSQKPRATASLSLSASHLFSPPWLHCIYNTISYLPVFGLLRPMDFFSPPLSTKFIIWNEKKNDPDIM